MRWFNGYALIFMTFIMIPSFVFAFRCRDGFANVWRNKTVEALEQIGRFGCFGLMIFNIPRTVFGFWTDRAFAAYLIGNSILVGLYCIVWAVCFRKNSVFRALALSLLPSAVFLFSGILIRSIPLIVAAAIFAPCHIVISYQNAVRAK